MKTSDKMRIPELPPPTFTNRPSSLSQSAGNAALIRGGKLNDPR